MTRKEKKEKLKQVKAEDAFMNSIKNPLFKTIYGLVRFHRREIYGFMFMTALCCNLMDIDLKGYIVKIIEKLF